MTRSPIPAEVTAAEAAGLPEVITVPTAGIRERTNLAIPRWLAAVMLIIPAFALFALGGSATGECGEATELATNVITGQVVNCDGTEFTGSGAGGGGGDFVAMGEDVYMNVANCDGCHGGQGQGGVGPAFGGVLTTFGSCADHIEWVTLGSQGFLDAGESSYGDTGKPIAGGMPAFGASLTEEQLAVGRHLRTGPLRWRRFCRDPHRLWPGPGGRRRGRRSRRDHTRWGTACGGRAHDHGERRRSRGGTDAVTPGMRIFFLGPQSSQSPSQGPRLDLPLGEHDVARPEEDRHPQPIIPGQSIVGVDIDLLDDASDPCHCLLDDRTRLVAEMASGPNQESERRIVQVTTVGDR